MSNGICKYAITYYSTMTYRLSRRGFPIRGNIVALETRILEVSCAPRCAAVIAAIHRVAVRRVEAGAGVEGINGERFGVGRQQLVVLRNGTIGPLVGFLGLGVEALAHRRLDRKSTRLNSSHLG